MKPRGSRILEDHEELEKGRTYIVKRFNGADDDRVRAELIHVKTVCNSEIRKNRDEKRERNLHNPSASQETIDDEDLLQVTNHPLPTKRMHKLYYIHYAGQDRRLDEWVERERFIEFVSDAAKTQENIEENCNKRALTRSQRKIQEEFHHVLRPFVAMDPVTAQLEKEHEERTKVKHINNLILGKHEIRVWYYSPFPSYAQTDVLYVCEFCLGYTPIKEQYNCHRFHKCNATKPPGIEIYRSGNVAVYEVDGEKQKIYCQCLCLVSKLFIDHKTLYYDVDSFLFYVLCEVSDDGARIAGHFSKERFSENNLACIMILPQYQRKGYGKFLIQFSYELSKREGWIGGPERPLSDLGKVSYRSYWWWKIFVALGNLRCSSPITASELAALAGIEKLDVDSTLGTVQFFKGIKGGRRIPVSGPNIENLKMQVFRLPKLLMDPDCLHWEPKNIRDSPRSDSVDVVE